jgi:hypothetical protein
MSASRPNGTERDIVNRKYVVIIHVRWVAGLWNSCPMIGMAMFSELAANVVTKAVVMIVNITARCSLFV